MAFGKKKDEAAPAAEGIAPEAEAADVASDVAAVAEPPADAPEAAAAEAAAAEAAPEAGADPLAGGTDALLSAFQTTQIEEEDRSTLLDLAGEHDLAGLLDDLHTVAAALGIVLDEDDAEDQAA